MIQLASRRSFLAVTGAGVALAACHEHEDEAEDVGAIEDLMREHGVIRRILVVYREVALRLHESSTSVAAEPFGRAALLMQQFGENYHERLLEEAHLFPVVKKSGGPAAALIDPLIAQHNRGREITNYVLAVAHAGISPASAEPLARTLEGFARMYEEHAAYEDTVVFQAFKKSLSRKDLAELGEKFEDIEHQTFGKDGFDDANEKIAAIEQALDIKLSALLPPAPPTI